LKFDLRHYTIRRKVFTLFGAKFHVFDDLGNVVGFSSQKAFKLREDIRIFADESRSTELMAIRARQVIDFAAAYDFVDSAENRKIGGARRKGWSSFVRDSWELLDEQDQVIATLTEDSTAKALLRRVLSNLIPQKFHLRGRDGAEQALLQVHFNPFIYRLTVTRHESSDLDPRQVFGMAVLVCAIEGRQK